MVIIYYEAYPKILLEKKVERRAIISKFQNFAKIFLCPKKLKKKLFVFK